jgi:hypothetical protein
MSMANRAMHDCFYGKYLIERAVSCAVKSIPYINPLGMSSYIS